MKVCSIFNYENVPVNGYRCLVNKEAAFFFDRDELKVGHRSSEQVRTNSKEFVLAVMQTPILSNLK